MSTCRTERLAGGRNDGEPNTRSTPDAGRASRGSRPPLRSASRPRLARLLGLALGVCALAFSTQEAAAQTCADDIFSGSLGCTSGDTKIAKLSVLGKCTLDAAVSCTIDANCSALAKGTCDISLVDGCSYIGDTAGVKLQAELVSTATARYDIGIYIATDAGNALTGECLHDFLPPPLSAACAATTSGTGPFCDDDGDTCGDIKKTQGTILYNIGYRSSPATEPVTLTLKCVDSDADGFVDVGSVITWDQQGANNCASVAGTVAGAPSKCEAGRIKVEGLPVPTQSIELRKLLNPISDAGTFALQIDATTYATGGDLTSTGPRSVAGGVSHTVGELANDPTGRLFAEQTERGVRAVVAAIGGCGT